MIWQAIAKASWSNFGGCRSAQPSNYESDDATGINAGGTDCTSGVTPREVYRGGLSIWLFTNGIDDVETSATWGLTTWPPGSGLSGCCPNGSLGAAALRPWCLCAACATSPLNNVALMAPIIGPENLLSIANRLSPRSVIFKALQGVFRPTKRPPHRRMARSYCSVAHSENSSAERAWPRSSAMPAARIASSTE